MSESNPDKLTIAVDDGTISVTRGGETASFTLSGQATKVPPPSTSQLADVGGSIYAPIIAGQITQERARKAAIEGHALTVVQSSAGFLTVFTAIVTATRGTTLQPQSLPSLATWFVGLAVIFFLCAAIVGTLVLWHNGIRAYGGLRSSDVRDWSENAYWDSKDLAEAGKRVATSQIEVLDAVQRHNKDTAQRFKSSLTLECVALACLVTATALLVANSSLQAVIAAIGVVLILLVVVGIPRFGNRAESKAEVGSPKVEVGG